MKRSILSSAGSTKYVGRTWSDLLDELERAGYVINSAYTKPSPWIEVRRNGKLYDVEVTKYHDGSYEVMEYSIYEANHNDLVDEVIDEIGDIVSKLYEHGGNDKQVQDIAMYLKQVMLNIESYRSSNYE